MKLEFVVIFTKHTGKKPQEQQTLFEHRSSIPCEAAGSTRLQGHSPQQQYLWLEMLLLGGEFCYNFKKLH